VLVKRMYCFSQYSMGTEAAAYTSFAVLFVCFVQ